MPNMSLKKNEMPSQEPNVRNKNFSEVALGYTAEQAVDEANRPRFLLSKKPGLQLGKPADILSDHTLISTSTPEGSSSFISASIVLGVDE